MHFSTRKYYPSFQSLLAAGILRDQAVSMVFGCAIAKTFPVHDQLSIPESHFIGEHGEATTGMITALNNFAPVDIHAIRVYAAKFYRLNHCIRHGSGEFAPKTDNAIYDDLGFTTVFNQHEIELMVSHDGVFQKNIKWALELMKTYQD